VVQIGNFLAKNFFSNANKFFRVSLMLKSSNLKTVFDFIEQKKRYVNSNSHISNKIKLSIFSSFSYISDKNKQLKLKQAGDFSL
jgi:hypothetical protein